MADKYVKLNTSNGPQIVRLNGLINVNLVTDTLIGVTQRIRLSYESSYDLDLLFQDKEQSERYFDLILEKLENLS